MHVVIFEGPHWTELAPLSFARPVFMCLSGMSPLLDKQIRHLNPDHLTLWVRPALAEYTRRVVLPTLSIPADVNVPLSDEPALIVNGRTLFFKTFEYPHEPGMAAENEYFVRHALVKSPGLAPDDVFRRSPNWMRLFDLPQMMPQGRIAHWPWDLIAWNEESLVEDSIHLARCTIPKPAGPYHIVNDSKVCLGPSVRLDPGVVLDGSKGPVIVEKYATIGANSVLQGPCYIGPYSTVAPMSLIRRGTSVGPSCIVGGEIVNSILQGYSNKAHYGYLGDSYVGQCVNLGAGTTTSNLKNTLGPISMQIGSRKIPTDRRKLGTVIGDHVKTAIHTRLNTGTYVGYCSMLATSEPLPHFIPSFSFWTDHGHQKYELDKARQTMSRFLNSRDLPWTDLDEQLLAHTVHAAAEIEQ